MTHARWSWGWVLALTLAACGTAPQPAAPPETGERAAPERHVLQYGRTRDLKLRPVDVYASSTYKQAFASYAVNDDTNVQWASGGYQEPEAWLVLQFRGQQFFDYADIKTGPLARGASYRFEVSNDGRHWRPVSPRMRNTSWQMEAKTINAQGRFLRIHFYNSRYNPMARFSVFEVDVYGSRGPGGYAGGGGYGYGGGYDGGYTDHRRPVY